MIKERSKKDCGGNDGKETKKEKVQKGNGKAVP